MLQTGTIVALKKVSLKRLDDGIPNQVLREILALQHMNHENVNKIASVILNIHDKNFYTDYSFARSLPS